jgi:hypothetical protein
MERIGPDKEIFRYEAADHARFACGVRAMLGMQSHRQDDHTYEDNAHTIRSTNYSSIGTL